MDLLDERPDLETLLAAIDAAWAEVADLVAGATPEMLAHPGADGRSATDILAHLSTWEASLVALLDGASRATAVGIDPAEYARLDTDAINARILERERARPAATVIEEATLRHESLRERLGALTDEDLLRPYAHYQPNETPPNERPVVAWIIGDTVGHYREHLPELGNRLVSG